jgi:trehalose/maltose hydrolase-like predicted phosphorylase
MKVARHNAFYSDADDTVKYMPLIGEWNWDNRGVCMVVIFLMAHSCSGNGYLAHAAGVLSDAMYVSGIFNGLTTSPSHRARIPAEFAVQINNSTTTGTLLDIENGVYHRRGVLSDGASTYEMRWYAHRQMRSLYVCELVATNIVGNVNVAMTNNRGDDSEDFLFTAPKAVGDSASVTCGETVTAETHDGPKHTVCVTSSTVPTDARPLTLTPKDTGKVFTFISAFRTELDVEQTNLRGVSTVVAAASQADFFAGMKLAHTRSAEHSTTHQLLRSHMDGWKQLWKSGVEVAGRPDVAIAVNASFFAILSSVRDDWAQGLAPGGLTNWYNGHSFWDTETWMYPSLLFLHPTISQVSLTCLCVT